MKQMYSSKHEAGESLDIEDAFSDFVNNNLETKKEQLDKRLVVLGHSFKLEKNPANRRVDLFNVKPGGDSQYQWQLGPMTVGFDLHKWMSNYPGSDLTLKSMQAHLFDCRVVLADSSCAITWMAGAKWMHRDVHPSNLLVESDPDNHHIKRKKIRVRQSSAVCLCVCVCVCVCVKERERES